MKKLAVILLVAVIALSLAACSKFKCDLCGEEKFGKVNQTTFLGQDMQYCNDCKDDLQEFADALKNMK